MLAQHVLNKEEGVKLSAAWLLAFELLKIGEDRLIDPAKSTMRRTEV